jgi:hypothetical protein
MTPEQDRALTEQGHGMPMKRPVAVTLAAAAIAAALAGCTTPFSHASSPATVKKTAATSTTAKQKVSTTAKTKTGPACPGQEAWSLRAGSSVKALYADTGALAADASANNQPGITKAGRKLASDALAAATLPLPPADASSWKVLTAAYAAAGTALAEGDASGAVPELEAGSNAISAFSSAVATCLAATG